MRYGLMTRRHKKKNKKEKEKEKGKENRKPEEDEWMGDTR
jgi:hypothetical protein